MGMEPSEIKKSIEGAIREGVDREYLDIVKDLKDIYYLEDIAAAAIALCDRQGGQQGVRRRTLHDVTFIPLKTREAPGAGEKRNPIQLPAKSVAVRKNLQGVQRSQGSQAPQGGQRPRGGERPQDGQRPQGGQRSPGGERPRGGRPQGGQRPQGGRPQGGQRPRSQRSQGGERPHGSQRPQGGQRDTGSQAGIRDPAGNGAPERSGPKRIR